MAAKVEGLVVESAGLMKFDDHPKVIAHTRKMNELRSELEALQRRQVQLSAVVPSQGVDASDIWNRPIDEEIETPRFINSKVSQELADNAKKILRIEAAILAGNTVFWTGSPGQSALRNIVSCELSHLAIPEFADKVRGVRDAVISLKASLNAASLVVANLEYSGADVCQPIDLSFSGPMLCYHDREDGFAIIDQWLRDIDESLSRLKAQQDVNAQTAPVPPKPSTACPARNRQKLELA